MTGEFCEHLAQFLSNRIDESVVVWVVHIGEHAVLPKKDAELIARREYRLIGVGSCARDTNHVEFRADQLQAVAHLFFATMQPDGIGREPVRSRMKIGRR